MKTAEQNKQNQQTCENCGRVVGCDYNGRKHKCKCKTEKDVLIAIATNFWTGKKYMCIH